MTPEDTKYYENYLDLFATDGWKQFLDDLQDRLDAYSIDYLTNEKELFKTQGEIAVLRGTLGFEAFIKQALETS